MTVVRGDARGLFVIAGGYKARPGAVRGYDHAYRMDDGGLNVGDHVKARHIPGSPITKITTADGVVLRWHRDGGMVLPKNALP